MRKHLYLYDSNRNIISDYHVSGSIDISRSAGNRGVMIMTYDLHDDNPTAHFTHLNISNVNHIEIETD